jgi:hypothetical protein
VKSDKMPRAATAAMVAMRPVVVWVVWVGTATVCPPVMAEYLEVAAAEQRIIAVMQALVTAAQRK